MIPNSTCSNLKRKSALKLSDKLVRYKIIDSRLKCPLLHCYNELFLEEEHYR